MLECGCFTLCPPFPVSLSSSHPLMVADDPWLFARNRLETVLSPRLPFNIQRLWSWTLSTLLSARTLVHLCISPSLSLTFQTHALTQMCSRMRTSHQQRTRVSCGPKPQLLSTIRSISGAVVPLAPDFITRVVTWSTLSCFLSPSGVGRALSTPGSNLSGGNSSDI